MSLPKESYKDGVFLSGLWRSGSTFVWSEFRKNPGAYCFYEPLNQGLGRLNKKRIVRYNPEVTKVNTHPILEKPYFAEFEPLMKRRGVRGFKRRFAYRNFAMTEDEKDPALKDYIASLCKVAQKQNLTPVLGCNRTIFRTQWLKENFDALHVHIDRNPRDIWSSYLRLTQHGNFTYPIIWLTIIERNAGNALFRPLAEKYRLRGPLQKLLFKPKSFYRRALRIISPEETYAMVFYLWCGTILHALSHSDLIIDIGYAGTDGYPEFCAEKINAASGLKVNLSGLRPDTSGHDEINFEDVETEVLKYFPSSKLGTFINRTKILSRLPEISADKAALVERLV